MPAKRNPTPEQVEVLRALPPGMLRGDVAVRLGVDQKIVVRWAGELGVALTPISEAARARMRRDWANPELRAARTVAIGRGIAAKPKATGGCVRIYVAIRAFVPPQHRRLYLNIIKRDGQALADRTIRRIMREGVAERVTGPVAPAAAQQIADLKRELAEAQERLALFQREFLGQDLPIPPEWMLTRLERQLAALLLLRPFVTREQAMMALYGDRSDEEPDPRIIDVLLSRLRGKTERYGFQVERVIGEGCFIPAPVRRALLRQIHGAPPTPRSHGAPDEARLQAARA